jgi:hypothetical protein
MRCKSKAENARCIQTYALVPIQSSSSYIPKATPSLRKQKKATKEMLSQKIVESNRNSPAGLLCLSVAFEGARSSRLGYV